MAIIKKPLALIVSLAIITMVLISVMPQLIGSAAGNGEERKTVLTENNTVGHDGANTIDFSLSSLGLKDEDVINSVKLIVSNNDGSNRLVGRLAINTTEGFLEQPQFDLTAAPPFEVTWDFTEAQSATIDKGGILQLGYWWGMAETVTVEEIIFTVNANSAGEEPQDPGEEPAAGTEISKDLTENNSVGHVSGDNTINFQLADLGVKADDVINSVTVHISNNDGSNRLNGRLGLSTSGDLLEQPAFDVTATPPFIVTWNLTEEQSALVDAGGFLQLGYWWGVADTVTVDKVIIKVNAGAVVAPPEDPQDPVIPPAPDDSAYLNYASALQASLYLYDANFCGPNVEKRSALSWRDDCHEYDVFKYNGQTIDLTGGFHDAGDHVKFGLPAAYSAFTLGMAYAYFGDAFVETKQDAHLKTITNHFAEYFRKCAVYENGKVVTFVYQVGSGDADHEFWGAPEAQRAAQGEAEQRVPYFTSDKNLCADIIGGTIAALAMNYINFGNEEDLKVAKDLYAYIHQYYDVILADTSNDTDDLEVVSKVPEYNRWEDGANQNNPWDYLSLGAIMLKIATDEWRVNKGTYDDFLDPKGISPNKAYFPANWDGVWPYYHSLSAFCEALNSIATGDEEPFTNLLKIIKSNDLTATGVKEGYTTDFDYIQQWGSARLNANLQFEGLVYDWLTDGTGYSEWARGQMDYLFGKNPEKQAFIVGYNFRNDVKYPLYPHHRAADGGDSSPGAWKDDASVIFTRPQKNVLLGALVGGPQTNDLKYWDALNNYVGNEVAIDYQAGFIGALAGLYLAFQNDGTDGIVEPPSKLAAGVKDMYALTPVANNPGGIGGGSNNVVSSPQTGDTSDNAIKIALIVMFASVIISVFTLKRKIYK